MSDLCKYLPIRTIVDMSRTIMCKSSQRRVLFGAAFISLTLYAEGQLLSLPPRAHDSATRPISPTNNTIMVHGKYNLTCWLRRG